MVTDNRAEENCAHGNVYRQNVNSNQFYVRCGICNEILSKVTHSVNPIPQDSYTRIISRREMERKRRPSTQSLEAVR